MKRILLVTFSLFLAVQGYSQEAYNAVGNRGANTLFGLYLGAGCATSNNYNVAPSAGFFFIKGIKNHSFIGADLFYQTYSLRYDHEQNSAKNGTGVTGVILKHASSFVYVAPKFEYGLGKMQKIHAYVSFGVGFKVGGFDTLRKWDHSYNSTDPLYYDSVVDLAKNINSMMMRVGFGFKEYLAVGENWLITFTEDFGFTPKGLTKTGDTDAPARTPYSPHKLNPGYITIQVGICHSRNSTNVAR